MTAAGIPQLKNTGAALSATRQLDPSFQVCCKILLLQSLAAAGQWPAVRNVLTAGSAACHSSLMRRWCSSCGGSRLAGYMFAVRHQASGAWRTCIGCCLSSARHEPRLMLSCVW